MSIDKDKIKHVSKLARISVDEKKIDDLTKDLSSIFEFIEQLNELNTPSAGRGKGRRSIAGNCGMRHRRSGAQGTPAQNHGRPEMRRRKRRGSCGQPFAQSLAPMARLPFKQRLPTVPQLLQAQP